MKVLNLENKMKKVLLTGGSRGIGLEIKKIFESNGYFVYAPTRNELDLSNIDSIKKFIENHKNDTYDVLVNNAGINEINLIENVKETDIENTFNINLIAPIYLLKSFVPKMKTQKYGRIVNIASIWSVVSKPGRGIYSATKRGIHGITTTLALEVANENILVNTVCPGFTLTELTSKNNSTEQIGKIAETIPLKRLAQPEEIAEIVFYLCSEKNTYITGQEIVIDGGYSVQ